MAFQLGPFSGIGLSAPALAGLLDEHDRVARPRYERLWSYYRNPEAPRRGLFGEPDGPRRLAQERGLPSRLTGVRGAIRDDRAAAREIVIENDIAWRLHAMVDFMFGKPISFLSTAADASKRETIQRVLDAVFEASGGIALLQDMALLGGVHGHVALRLRTDGLFGDGGGANARGDADRVIDLASKLRVEIVEAPRGVAQVNASDYRVLDAFVLRAPMPGAEREEAPRARFLESIRDRVGLPRRGRGELLEVVSAAWRQVYAGERLVVDEPNELGAIPVAHIQNISQPLRYEGQSEVEPLIPLQDELNTRLSDRANRVTMQSFKMYLAKGLDGFGDGAAPVVGPGRVWTTDNPDASMETFGGDAASPSEDRHIDEVRAALDKASSVTPLAAGVVEARLGNLTSSTALRITLLGLLAKTARKQVTYGRGLGEMAGLILRALDVAGVYSTSDRDRGVRIQWPEAIPTDERESLESARIKLELGVPRERVLAELGYAPTDPGVV
ncbi:MAG: phage portal protein [Phycisphaeraceae bacterium]|nr:phage portal protein [Phycisphaeraceae bacterium]MCB9847013.1 phage portal protein [Phycisphaeraceae bacterium]